jgi:protein required for attachment to host cells
LAESEQDKVNLKERDWIWVKRFYDETEAIKWLNKEEEYEEINEIESSKKEDDDEDQSKDNAESHKSTKSNSDEPYKDHDRRSNKYDGRYERDRGKNRKSSQEDDFPHVEYGDYQPAWHGWHDGVVMVISSITSQNNTTGMRTEWIIMSQWETRNAVIDDERIKESSIKMTTRQVIGIESENLESGMASTVAHQEKNGQQDPIINDSTTNVTWVSNLVKNIGSIRT